MDTRVAKSIDKGAGFGAPGGYRETWAHEFSRLTIPMLLLVMCAVTTSTIQQWRTREENGFMAYLIWGHMKAQHRYRYDAHMDKGD